MKRRGFLKSLTVLVVGAPLVPTIIPKMGKATVAAKASVSADGWAAFSMPVIRQIFPTLVAKDFVDIQPMNVPSGRIFYMDIVTKKPWYQFW